MATLSRNDIEAEQNDKSASSSDGYNSASSFENEFDAKATNTPASALVGTKVVEAPGNVSRHEKVEQSDSFDNEYDADFSDPAIQFVQDSKSGPPPPAIPNGSRPSLPEAIDSSDASDSEYTSGSSEANDEELTTPDVAATIDDRIHKASSDQDDDVLELAARVHAAEQTVSYDEFASDSAPGANVGVGGLSAPVRSISLDSANTEDDTSDSDFDLALEASMRAREAVTTDDDASESFADEYDSAASLQDDAEMANDAQAAISNGQSDDENALELAATIHGDDHQNMEEVQSDRGEGTLAQLAKVPTGFAESDDDDADDDEDLALAASLHDTEDRRNKQEAPEASQNEHRLDAQDTPNSYIASPDILDAEEAVSSLVKSPYQASRGDVDAAISSDEDEDLALAAAVHSENRVDPDQEDASASASVARENEVNRDSKEDDGFFEGRGIAATTSTIDINDEATLELSASLHASHEENKVPDEKQDSFADEFNAEASSDDEKEDSFADEYNPESNGLDANSSDDDHEDEAAPDTAAAYVNGDDLAESSSDASYTSGASNTEGNGDGIIAMHTEAHAVFGTSASFDDADNDALELAASLHNTEDPGGTNITVQDPQPEPKSLAKMELLAQSTDSSDNEDDELMMAAALLEREDDSSIGDRGGVTGYDDELQALQNYQQADGLFNDGNGPVPYTDDPPVLDDMASDSSYEPASSDDDDDVGNFDSNDDVKTASNAEDEDDSYESFGSYDSYENDVEDAGKEL
ncbi:MAG: hypothetical protein SGARI_000822, partial [Bacillariaceae sp.]